MSEIKEYTINDVKVILHDIGDEIWNTIINNSNNSIQGTSDDLMGFWECLDNNVGDSHNAYTLEEMKDMIKVVFYAGACFAKGEACPWNKDNNKNYEDLLPTEAYAYNGHDISNAEEHEICKCYKEGYENAWSEAAQVLHPYAQDVPLYDWTTVGENIFKDGYSVGYGIGYDEGFVDGESGHN